MIHEKMKIFSIFFKFDFWINYQFKRGVAAQVHFQIKWINAQVAAEKNDLVFSLRMNPSGCTVNNQWTLIEYFDKASAHSDLRNGR